MLRGLLLLLIAVLAVMIAGIFGGVFISVANAAAPGDALYSLDRQMEELQLQLTISSAASENLHDQFIQERLDEIRAVAESGDLELLSEAVENLDQAIAAAVEDVEDMDATQMGDASAGVVERAENMGTYCNGSTERHHPTGDTLADRFEVSYEDIMSWACGGYGFGEIKQAYMLNQNGVYETVEEIFALRESGMGWGEIKKGPLALEGDDQDGEDLDEEQDLEEGDDLENDGETTAEETSNGARGGVHCDGTGEKEHPAGRKIADSYGVEYDEIMGWFCGGNGFGEIKLAYDIAAFDGEVEDVSEIFEQRESGMGWGQIMQDHQMIGKNKTKKNGNPAIQQDNPNAIQQLQPTKKPKPTPKPKPAKSKSKPNSKSKKP